MGNAAYAGSLTLLPLLPDGELLAADPAELLGALGAQASASGMVVALNNTPPATRSSARRLISPECCVAIILRTTCVMWQRYHPLDPVTLRHIHGGTDTC